MIEITIRTKLVSPPRSCERGITLSAEEKFPAARDLTAERAADRHAPVRAPLPSDAGPTCDARPYALDSCGLELPMATGSPLDHRSSDARSFGRPARHPQLDSALLLARGRATALIAAALGTMPRRPGAAEPLDMAFAACR